MKKASAKELRRALYDVLNAATAGAMWRGNPYVSNCITQAILTVNQGSKLEGNKYDLPTKEEVEKW